MPAAIPGRLVVARRVQPVALAKKSVHEVAGADDLLVARGGGKVGSGVALALPVGGDGDVLGHSGLERQEGR